MTEQLKQRLLGTAVFIALAVIIVPELVIKPAAQEAGGIADITVPQEAALGKPLMTVSIPKEQEMTEPANVQVIVADTDSLSGERLMDDVLPSSEGVVNVLQQPTTIAMSDSNLTVQTASDLTARVDSTEVIEEISDDKPTITSASTPVERNVVVSKPLSEPKKKTQPQEVIAAITPVDVEQPLPTTAKKIVNSPSSSNPKPEIKLISLQRRSQPKQTQTSMASTKSSRSSKAWFVQAGSFKVKRNASLLRDRLRSYQFPVEMAKIEISGDILYRVQVGPYASKDETEQMRVRLQREAKVSGAVRRL